MNKSLQVSVAYFGLVCLNIRRQADEKQEINIQNMNVELVAQMFKNYQSNVLFHLEGMCSVSYTNYICSANWSQATDNLKPPS
jgi:DASH complex subunit Dad4